MSVGSQIEKFYQEVSEKQYLWFGEFPDGTMLEFDVSDNRVSLPVWSSKSRIVRLKKLNSDLLSEIEPREMSWENFKEHMVPILEDKNRLINLNLSGKNLTGFDLEISSLIRNLEARISVS
ncbi:MULTISPECIES: DUF2750 domain-containing protein [unclassified Colwellia]|jgi:hypothetical protein|uniref:DUF2750 domain-containing protein n=1 Tax=unclassified Colwellia TaxID=196834 RepID=UPI0015F4E97A|nr:MULTISPECIES: DUF2750 domain-containing protein [unclassified Colwellia]MBA6302674.1 DUF2750 domain-containing protein [Colwellia sp. MB02u-14]MBA6357953.1 DUF2750 domain-containing protein [Colwellia sp. BRX8-3]MBA6361498.1 DUF2750 domain-containing protein [Colwellia sp. BRX8-6]MBA6367216.1 DUF2750 domain-containing protein [Colwellia sp. BRX8-5]MBA6373542.1 DUF2750 domain-containing protein [Colwellia sp. BRX8-4]